MYKYNNFNYYLTSFYISDNLLTTTSYALFSLYFTLKYSYRLFLPMDSLYLWS